MRSASSGARIVRLVRFVEAQAITEYNAGQKFVFWSQAILVAVMFETGIGLWPAGLAYIEELLGFKATIDQRRMAAILQASAAVLTIAIWIIHVYLAIWVRGTISAMRRGGHGRR